MKKKALALASCAVLALSLLSGGIDSPVASYMIAKRGVIVDMIHYYSYPYTSPEAKEKVLELARRKLREKEPTRENLKKVSDYLARRGYGWEEISAALERIRAEWGD